MRSACHSALFLMRLADQAFALGGNHRTLHDARDRGDEFTAAVHRRTQDIRRMLSLERLFFVSGTGQRHQHGCTRHIAAVRRHAQLYFIRHISISHLPARAGKLLIYS